MGFLHIILIYTMGGSYKVESSHFLSNFKLPKIFRYDIHKKYPKFHILVNNY